MRKRRTLRLNTFFFSIKKIKIKDDACQSKPCYNGGNCFSQGGSSYICSCKYGFQGVKCEEKGT